MHALTTDTKPIPLLDLEAEIEEQWEELQAAFTRVMRSGRFILGPEVAAFEAEIGAYLEIPHAVGLNSGTDALLLGLRALGLQPGDEVITTPFTFFSTAEAISHLGAVPIFVDIDPETFNLDPAAVEAALTPRTRALLPVHLYGRPAPMAELMALAEAHDLVVLEDAAQSLGARYLEGTSGPAQGRQTGTMGHVGAFSLFPTKPLGAFGDAGVLVTPDAEVAETVRMLRAHGARVKYHNEKLGYNARLDALQAALLRVKLPHVDRRNAARRVVAARYNERLADVSGVVTPALPPGHVVHQYTVRILDGHRDAVQAALKAAGIQTMIYYPIPCHRLPYYDLDLHLPVAEQMAGEVLSLPIGSTLTEASQDVVVSALREALHAVRR
ncbi:MAG: DegT/DnrJ/EryC1/StrS family aminotransferase [Bacteroidota bacterium]